MEATISQRHCQLRENSKKSNKVHSKWLHLKLQRQVDCIKHATISALVWPTGLNVFDQVPQGSKQQYQHQKYVAFNTASTRATTQNRLKLNFTRMSTAKHFYYNRIAKLWEKIPCEIIDITMSLETIKSRLLSYLWTIFITNFNPDQVCTFQVICSCST